MARRTESRVLTERDEIQRWVEERGGRPAAVKRTASADDPGILRIDFPGYSGDQSLEEIEWDEFFDKFEEQGLALLVQDETAGGERSNFNKIISRETAQNGRGRNRSSGSRSSSGRSSSRNRTETRSGSRKRSGAAASMRKSSGRSSSRGRSTAKKQSTARASTGRRKSGSNRKSAASARRKTSSRGSGRRRAA